METRLNQVHKYIEQFGQAHLLDFSHELSPENLTGLLKQIESIDFELLSALFAKGNEVFGGGSPNIEPIISWVLEPNSSDYHNCHAAGFELIEQEKIAVVSMAGGQGTRLGHPGPKGTFRFAPPINKTLFQIQAEQLQELGIKHGHFIPWYLMTNRENNKDIKLHFVENNYFGCPPAKIFFFIQGELPLLSEEGKILLKDNSQICFGPDGNGGVFSALEDSGALADMERRGVEWVFFCGIDNALVKMADPVFAGYARLSGKQAASKAVAKISPEEKVGVFCLKNGRPSIVEYSELPESYRKKVDGQGNLMFADANIIAHLFKLEVLRKAAGKGLPYHLAHKKTACIDNLGNFISPSKPNSYKFETYIFDAFCFVDGMSILRVERAQEFAPVKNRTGQDSPETAQQLLLAKGQN